MTTAKNLLKYIAAGIVILTMLTGSFTLSYADTEEAGADAAKADPAKTEASAEAAGSDAAKTEAKIELKPETVDLGGKWFKSDAVTITEGELKPDELGLVIKKGKIGFIDNSGKVVIPCVYENDAMSKFYSNGCAVVVKDGKYGIINTAGQTIVPFVYDSIDSRIEDYTFVSATRDGKSGYINMKGEKGIPFCFDETQNFGNDKYKYGAVSLNDKWGLINADGEIALPVQYDWITFDHNGYIVVRAGSKQGLLGPDLKEVMPLQFDSIDVVPFGETSAVCVTNDDKSYIYSIEGKMLADCGEAILDYDYQGNAIGVLGAFSTAIPQTDASAAAADTGMANSYTLYNAVGGKVTDKTYEWYEVAGKAIACKTDTGCGLIDASGKELVPFKFDRVEVIGNSSDPVWFAFFKKGEGWKVFSDKGKKVKSLAWMKLTVPEDSEIIKLSDERIYVSDESVSHGPALGDLYDMDGNKLNPDKTKILSRNTIGSTAAYVDDSGKYGIINFDGKILLPCEFGAVESMENRLGKFYFAYTNTEGAEEENEKVTYINTEGKKVSGMDYDDPWESYLVQFAD